jgi:hypothetical protein
MIPLKSEPTMTRTRGVELHSRSPELGIRASRWQRIGPIVSLLLLAPFISELLYGAVRISTIFVLIPEVLTWGCGALLVRECVRRWRKAWQSMLMMGLALGIAEEWVIQQTSISPLVALGQHAYGRVGGVNWVYFLWALGFESVWVVLIPVQLTELLFPVQRERLWLHRRGLVIASTAFVLGACIAWYGWTQRARVKIFHMMPYSPPPFYIFIGVGATVLLILAARSLPSEQPLRSRADSHAAPPPRVVGLNLGAMGFVWAIFFLLGWGTGVLPNIPAGIALAAGLGWAIIAFYLVCSWTSRFDWGDTHRVALVLGGVVAWMLGGFVVFGVSGALRMDWIGKGVLNAAAAIWLFSLWPLGGRRTGSGGTRPTPY